jgi:hypothetical protein
LLSILKEGHGCSFKRLALVVDIKKNSN